MSSSLFAPAQNSKKLIETSFWSESVENANASTVKQTLEQIGNAAQKILDKKLTQTVSEAIVIPEASAVPSVIPVPPANSTSTMNLQISLTAVNKGLKELNVQMENNINSVEVERQTKSF
ncbi:MAG: hypothetical protein LEGION0398_MBIBDBAK_00477 [Legionellaceae bacterium]